MRRRYEQHAEDWRSFRDVEGEEFKSELRLAAMKLQRLAGILEQVADGGMDVDESLRPLYRSMVRGVAENARRLREITPSMVEQPLPALIHHLPFNRKERVYTGTVLPGIVAADSFAHLHHFLDLLGLDVAAGPDVADGVWGVQFLTEYGFGESAPFDQSGRWASFAGGLDTPDVVIAGTGWLIAVEAKMYARQGKVAIEAQLAAQQALVDFWAAQLDLSDDRVRLVALLPEQYAAEIGPLRWPVVTWQQVADAYRGLASPYWLAVLDEALSRYADLKSTFTPNAQGVLTGAQVVEQYLAGLLEFHWIGRQGGPTGAAFVADVLEGVWRTQPYQVRVDPVPPTNPNWWPIEDFIAAVRTSAEPD